MDEMDNMDIMVLVDVDLPHYFCRGNKTIECVFKLDSVYVFFVKCVKLVC